MASPDAVLQTMGKGQLFDKYEADGRGGLSKRRVTVFYDQGNVGAGTFYWCPAGSALKKAADRRLHLHQLTDVFLGKQTEGFSSDAAAKLPEDCCLSLNTAQDTWDLVAESEEQVTTWLAGINHVLTSSGKKVVLEEDEDQNETPQPPQQHQPQQQDPPVDLSPEETIAEMQKGFVFTTYQDKDGMVIKRDVLVFYEPDDKSGCFYWCAPGRKALLQDQCQPLAQITDVYLGKQTSVFDSPAALRAEEERCFSIISNDREVNFETRTPEQLNLWLSGINAILTQSGKKVVVDDDDEPQAQPQPSSSGKRSSKAPAAAAAEEDSAGTMDPSQIIAMMKQGRPFRIYERDVDGRPRTRKIVLFYSPGSGSGLGSLCWCRPNTKTESTARSLPLRTITDVFLGKQTPILLDPVARDAIYDNCFSVIGSSKTIDVEAESAEQLSAWLTGINHILTSSGTLTMMEEDDTGDDQRREATERPKRRFSVQAKGKKPAPRAAPAAKSAAPAPAQGQTKSQSAKTASKMMTEGALFTYFYKSSADTRENKKRKVKLFFNASAGKYGSLYWCAPKDKEEKANRCIDMDDITDVYVGKQTDVLTSRVARSADADACLSIFTRTSRQLDLEADSPETLTRWLHSINAVLSNSGKDVMLEDDGDFIPAAEAAAKKPERRYSVVPQGQKPKARPRDADEAELSAGQDATIRMMVKGREFTSYWLEKGVCRSERIMVNYEPSDGANGSLAWYDIEGRGGNANSRLALHKISDVFLGKQTQTMQTGPARQADPDACFSIICRTGEKLELQAESPELLAAWLQGINSILTNGGKTILLEDEEGDKPALAADKAGGKSAPPRRYSVLNSPGNKSKGAQVQNDEVTLETSDDTQVATLQSGRPFTSYVQTSSGYKAQRIFLFYMADPNSNRPGRLCWCDEDQKKEVEGQALPLRSITDVYVGKQTRALNSEAAQMAVEDHCFSLIGSSSELHLEANSEEQLTAWLSGINHVLTGSGKKVVVLEDEESKRNSQRKFSVLNRGDANPMFSSETKLAPTSNSGARMMTAGRIFTLYTQPNRNGPVEKSDIFLFYNKNVGRSGSLYWCAPGQRLETDAQCLPLHTLTDVYVGKQSNILRSRTARPATEDCCVTLMSRRHTLDLEASNAEQATAWLTAISQLLSGAGKKVVMENENDGAGAKGSRRYSVMNKGAKKNATAAASINVGNDAHEEMMAKGHDFNLFDEQTKQEVVLFYDPKVGKDGTVYYCPRNQPRSRVDKRALPLHTLSEVYVGKQTAVLKAPHARPANVDACFSLVGRHCTLDLEASSPEVMTAWLAGINAILTGKAGKKVVLDKSSHRNVEGAPDYGRRFSVLSKVMSSEHVITLGPDQTIAVRMMAEGRDFYSYDTGRREEVHVFYEPAKGGPHGSLYWCEVGLRHEDNDMTMPLHTITDVYLEKQTPRFQAPCADEARPECCFSILSRSGKQLNLEAHSPEQLQAWLDGINHLLTHKAGKRVALDNAQKQRAGNRRFSVMNQGDKTDKSQQEMALSLSPAAQLDIIRNGAEVTLYDSVGPNRQFLWYDDREGSHGVLHWSAPGTRDYSHDRKLALDKITDMYMGKQTEEFKGVHGRNARADNCFSLRTRSQTLNVETDSAESLISWLASINRALTSGGLEVVLENEDAVKRKYSVLARVGFEKEVNAMRGGSTQASPAAQRERVGQRSAVPGSYAGSDASNASVVNQSNIALTNQDAVDAMCNGAIFSKYELRPSPHIEEVQIWYERDGSPHGILYWCPAGYPKRKRNDVQSSLPLHQITDIFLGKQTRTLEAPFARHAVEDHCVSLLGRGVAATLHLEADNAAVTDTWVAGINHILTSSGQSVVQEQEQGGAQTGTRRFSVLPSKAPAQERGGQSGGAPRDFGYDDDDAHSVASITSVQVAQTTRRFQEDDSALSVPMSDTVRMMMEGRQFTGYAINRKGKPVKSQILLFFNPSAGGASGSLFWSPIDHKRESKHCCLPLDQLTDVMLGKNTDPLKSSLANNAEADRCVSFVGTNKAIDLEASSTEELSAWLFGINSILTSGGKDFVLDEESENDKRRKFSVVRHQPGDNRKKTYVTPLGLPSNPEETLRQMMDPRRATVLSISPNETIRMMANGRTFTVYELGVKRKMHLFFAPLEEENGTLFWCDVGQRVESRHFCLPLHTLTTVLLEKQTDVMRSAIADSAIPKHCFSLVGKDRTLNVEAENQQHVTAWMYGINSVLAGGGRKVMLDTEFGQRSTNQARRYQIVPMSEQHVRTAMEVEQRRKAEAARAEQGKSKKPAPDGGHGHAGNMSVDEVVKQMVEGAEFVSYAGSDVKKSNIFLFCEQHEGRAGTLYWCEPGQQYKKSPLCCLPLHTVSDIYIGKMSKALESAAARDAPDECCFSIIGRDDMLNLQAVSLSQARVWLFGINHLITTAAEKGAKQSSAPSSKNDADVDRLLGSRYLSVEAKATSDLLATGRDFVRYYDSSQPKREDVFLFYRDVNAERKMLYWCAPGHRVADDRNSLDLTELREVQLGKSSVVLKSRVADSAYPEACVTLILRDGHEMSFEAASPEVLTAWLSAIDTIVRAGGKRAVRVDDDRSRSEGVRRFSIVASAAGSSAPTSALDLPPEERVRMLIKGQNFTMYSGNDDREIVRRELFLFYDPNSGRNGSLYWCPRGRREHSDANMLPMHLITDVFVGKQTRAFQTRLARSADVASCFSLRSRAQELNIECPSPEHLVAWLGAINHLLMVAGKAVELEQNQDASAIASRSARGQGVDQRRKYSILQKVPLTKTNLMGSSSQHAASLELLSKGQEFVVFENPARPTSRRALVFYDSSQGKAGTLFWCAPGRRDRNAGDSIEVRAITDILFGKQTDILQSKAAQLASDDCCCSVIGKFSSLHLQATTAKQQEDWVHALHSVLLNSGRVQLELDESPEEKNQREAMGLGAHETPTSRMAGGRRRISVIPEDQRGGRAAAPFSGGSASSMAQGLSNMEYDSLLKELRQGRLSLLFFADRQNHFAEKQRVFVGGNPGQERIFWCPSDKREQREVCSVAVREINDVYVGKQTRIMLSTVASKADPRSCISIIGERCAINMDCGSPEHMNQWLQVIQRLVLSTTDKRVVQNQDLTPNKPDAEARRHFSVVKREGVGIGGAVGEILLQGRTFTSYSDRGVEELFLFYSPNKGKVGSFFWCAPGRREESDARCIGLNRISDIFVGKQTAVLNKMAAHVPYNMCFSILSKRHTLNLSAKSSAEASEFLSEISSALSGAGMTVVQSEEGAVGSRAQSPPGKRGGERKYSVHPASSQASIHASQGPASIQMLKRGRVCTVYEGSPDHPFRTSYNVFYSRNGGHLGSMYWTAPGSRVENFDQCLPLHTITDLCVGKMTPQLQSRAASNEIDSNCLALLGKASNLHLVLGSEDEVTRWVDAITSLLKRDGKNVEDEVGTVVGSPAKRGQANADNRRFSVLPGAQSAAEIGRAKRTIANDPVQEDTAVKAMARGANYTSYSGESAERVFMWYDASQGGYLGSFQWCAPGNKSAVPGQRLPLHRITDIMQGKHTEPFVSGLGRRAADESCITFLTSVSELNLEAEDEAARNDLLQGLVRLLDCGGKNVEQDGEAVTPAEPKKKRFSVMKRPATDDAGQRGGSPNAAEYTGPLDGDLHAMTKGTDFVLYGPGNSKQVVTLRYSRSGGKAGSLEYVIAKKSTKVVPLHTLTDIYMGKQTDALRSPVAEHARPECCMSILSRSGVDDLEAADEATAQRWLRGINGVLTNSGKKVVQEDEQARSDTQRRRFSVLPYKRPTALPDHPAETMKRLADFASGQAIDDDLTKASNSETLLMMQNGRQFTGFFRNSKGAIVKTTVSVFYNPTRGELGTMFWCMPGKRKEMPECALELSDLQELYLGKQTAIMQSPQAASADPDRCFSLIGNVNELNLEAESAEMVSAFLFGINSVFTRSGNTVVQDDAGPQVAHGVAGRRFSVIRPHSSEAPKDISDVLSQATNDSHLYGLVQGRNFWRYHKDPATGKVVREQIYVFLIPGVPEKASIYWCAPGVKRGNPKRAIPLSTITDIYCGKHTACLKSQLAGNAAQTACISIIGKTNRLELEAESSKVVDEWLVGLNHALSTNGKVVQQTDSSKKAAARTGGKERAYSVLPYQKPDVVPDNPHHTMAQMSDRRPTLLAASNYDTVRMMSNGRNFMRFESNNISTEVNVFYNALAGGRMGSLFWCPSGRREEYRDCCLPLHTITGLYLGKQTAAFQTPVGRGADSDRSWTLVGRDGLSLDLQAETTEQLSAWLYGINSILQSSGKKVVKDNTDNLGGGSVQGVDAKDTRRFSVLPSNALEDNVSAVSPDVRSAASGSQAGDSAVPAMVQGSIWTQYEDMGDGQPCRQRKLFLFYEPGQAQGSLYWCDPGRRDKVAANCIPLHEITDIYCGKQTEVFKKPELAHLNDEACMSLMSDSKNDGPRELHLMADSEQTLTVWLTGIDYVLVTGGAGVELPDGSTAAGDASDAGGVSSNPLVRQMQAGSNFFLYDNPSNPVRNPITLFCSGSGQNGALNWCARGERVSVQGSSLNLADLTDIYVGKQTALLKTELADNAEEGCCLSIISMDGTELNLEAESEEVVNLWLQGLETILSDSGKNVTLDDEGEETVASEAPPSFANSPQKRYSVASSAASRATSRQALVAGALFSRCTLRGARDVNLFLNPEEGDMGTLYWCDRNERNQYPDWCLPLDEITAVSTGKNEKPLIKHAENVPDEHCFTLKGSQPGNTLMLVASNREQVTAWLHGINDILIGHGRASLL